MPKLCIKFYLRNALRSQQYISLGPYHQAILTKYPTSVDQIQAFIYVYLRLAATFLTMGYILTGLSKLRRKVAVVPVKPGEGKSNPKINKV